MATHYPALCSLGLIDRAGIRFEIFPLKLISPRIADIFFVVVLVAYRLLHLTSGRVVHYAFSFAGVTVADEDCDTGTAFGKIENVLVLTLMLLQAYTALGIIFAAKSLVRKDDIDTGDTQYYLLGTLANFPYSVVVGMVVHGGLVFLVA